MPVGPEAGFGGNPRSVGEVLAEAHDLAEVEGRVRDPSPTPRVRGGTVDAHGSEPCVRKDLRVRLPPGVLKGNPARALVVGGTRLITGRCQVQLLGAGLGTDRSFLMEEQADWRRHPLRKRTSGESRLGGSTPPLLRASVAQRESRRLLSVGVQVRILPGARSKNDGPLV
jgi:hypothetical protein